MKSLRASVILMFPLWVAACATAQDTGPGPDGAAGAASPQAGASTSGSSNPGAGAGGRFGGGAGSTGAGSTSAGSNAGGQVGGAGRAGASGSAGAAGSSGGSGGGGGGAPPVFDPGACAATPTMSLQYQQGSTQQAVISAQYQFTNTSDTPVPIGSLSIRYFFSNEETSAWKPSVYSAQVDGGTGGYRKIDGATQKVVPLGSKADGADTYAELTFGAGITLEKGATAKVSWDLQPTSYDPPAQVQSNDYSYNAADIAFTVWDHVAIYQGPTLVWGCLPKAAGGGAGNAGSGGAPGNGGAGGAAGGGTVAGSGGALTSGGSAGSMAGGGGLGGNSGAP